MLALIVAISKNYVIGNNGVIPSLQEALKIVGNEEAFIAGGEMLYRESLPIIDKMYITMIDQIVEGDTFFPHFKEEDFCITSEERFDGDIPYTYLTYQRRTENK